MDRSAVSKRFTDLQAEGGRLVSSIPPRPGGTVGYRVHIEDRRVGDYSAWLASCANLIQMVAPQGSSISSEVSRLLAATPGAGVATNTVLKMYGLLQSAATEWNAGMLNSIEHIVAAATFDDFLDHAAAYHKGGKKIEAAVLASAVFEDAIKRIARKNEIVTAGVTVEPLVDQLAASGVLTPVKAKRAKAYAAIRNKPCTQNGRGSISRTWAARSQECARSSRSTCRKRGWDTSRTVPRFSQRCARTRRLREMEPTAAELARLILRLSPYVRRLPPRLELRLLAAQAAIVRSGLSGRRARPSLLKRGESAVVH